MEMDLRDQIIQVATDLFMEIGFTATSTRQIAQILNISQPALYHHFKNKEDLYIEVVIKFTRSVGKDLHTVVKQEVSLKEKLFNMTKYLHVNHPVNLSMMLHDIDQEVSEELRYSIFRIWWDNYYSPIEEYFKQTENYLIDDVNSSTASRHYLRVLSSYITEDKYQDFDESLTVFEIMMIFLRGITKHKYHQELGIYYE